MKCKCLLHQTFALRGNYLRISKYYRKKSLLCPVKFSWKWSMGEAPNNVCVWRPPEQENMMYTSLLTRDFVAWFSVMHKILLFLPCIIIMKYEKRKQTFPHAGIYWIHFVIIQINKCIGARKIHCTENLKTTEIWCRQSRFLISFSSLLHLSTK